MHGKLMGRIVACVSAADESVIRLADCYGFLAEPSYCLEGVDGKHFNWGHTIVREATPEEQVQYWRERALKAENSSRVDAIKRELQGAQNSNQSYNTGNLSMGIF